MGIAILIIATFFSLFVTITFLRKQQMMNLFPLVAGSIIAVIFYAMPTDTRYYMLNVKWNYEIENDFITLDKYSWFLYKNGNREEALTTSDQALKMAKNAGQKQWIEFIEEHNKLIRIKNWQTYR
ncbi:MAG: hypothetical protein R2750_14440 [Bacteroidales bacterium]